MINEVLKMNVHSIQLNQPIPFHDLSMLDVLTKRRLKEVGISEGSVISVKRRYPFHGPCTIESDGQQVGIRRRTLELLLGDGY